jgi:hypothetical protein
MAEPAPGRAVDDVYAGNQQQQVATRKVLHPLCKANLVAGGLAHGPSAQRRQDRVSDTGAQD